MGRGAGVKEGSVSPMQPDFRHFRPVHILEQNVLVNGINGPELVLKSVHS